MFHSFLQIHTFSRADAIFSFINNDAVSCDACADANKLILMPSNKYNIHKNSSIIRKCFQKFSHSLRRQKKTSTNVNCKYKSNESYSFATTKFVLSYVKFDNAMTYRITETHSSSRSLISYLISFYW